MDAADAQDLDTAVSETANQLGRLGDASPLDERRARALGALAHPQQVLDLFEAHDPGAEADDASCHRTGTRTATGLAAWATSSATIYLHIDVDDLRAATASFPAAT